MNIYIYTDYLLKFTNYVYIHNSMGKEYRSEHDWLVYLSQLFQLVIVIFCKCLYSGN